MAGSRLVFAFVLVGFVLTGCHRMHRNDLYVDVNEANLTDGAALAVKYCQGCHALPDPSLADAKSWYNRILPEMGPRLGIFRHNNMEYPSMRSDRNLPPGFYPNKPLLSDTEWGHIVDYFSATSPDSLQPTHAPPAIAPALSGFTASFPAGVFSRCATALARFDTLSGNGGLMIADAITRQCYYYNELLLKTDSFPTDGPLVGIERGDNRSRIVCDIGILNPNNGRFGKLIRVPEQGSPDRVTVLADSLRRPVFFSRADLDGDGLEDYIVSEFGNLLGALSWLKNLGNNRFDRRVLLEQPGAIHTVIDDYNHDGRPDIWCLFSQGDEGISLFTNLGGGRFSRRQVLRFPPIYGSSGFELDDFNHDGFPDILYSCGDNADYSPVLKPYHGLYIFLNDGKNGFRQRYFFPQNGAYKAMARDFDGDGDLDIAAISFFPDYRHRPGEPFVYLENEGDFRFKASSTPETRKGRWLTMDVGDINHDGRPDILLGNFSIAPAISPDHPDWQNQPPFLVLTNTYH